MLLNYLKNAFRSIIKNRFYSILNIIGLSTGIVSTILIFLFVSDELSYDKHHIKHERIYRLESDFNISGKHDKFAIIPVPMGPALKTEMPEIEEFVRFADAGDMLIRANDKEFTEKDFYFADSTVFNVFTHTFLMGSPEKCLTESNTIVLTESTAKKYFGNENPMGKFVKDIEGNDFIVSAIIEDNIDNSHLKFDGLISIPTIIEAYGRENFNTFEAGAFWNIGVFGYIMLKENSSISNIYDKFPAFYDKYMKSVGDQVNASFNLMTRPLADIHLTSDLGSDLPTGNIIYIYIFIFVAVFMIVIAAINYTNMATARSAKRSREVGIRKVAGATSLQLQWQFLFESIIISALALLISIGIANLLLPAFNELSNKEITFSLIDKISEAIGISPEGNPFITWVTGILSLGLFAIIIGMIAGSYPAFYLSMFKPLSILKEKASKGMKGGNLRKVLVVFQFFISILMIIGTMGVSKQLKYLKSKDYGFDKENIVVLQMPDTTFRNKISSFKEELLMNPDIKALATSTGIPGRTSWIQVVKVEQEEKMTDYAMNLILCDYDFVDLMGFELKDGRDFDRNMGTDGSEAVIINETVARKLKWGDEALGKKIHWGFELDGSGGRIMKVIGVVKDFHYISLENEIEPMILFIREDPSRLISIRLNGNNKKKNIAFIESKWEDFNASRPFEYFMLDDNFYQNYSGQEKLGVIFRIFSLLTILIALLGLMGLSSYVAEQRTKEIGIRKVLGSSVGSIIYMLFRQFIYLIFIAFVLAAVGAWVGLDYWLSNFAYQTKIGWGTYIYSGVFAMLLAFIIVAIHSWRAANSNPVDAIKYE